MEDLVDRIERIFLFVSKKAGVDWNVEIPLKKRMNLYVAVAASIRKYNKEFNGSGEPRYHSAFCCYVQELYGSTNGISLSSVKKVEMALHLIAQGVMWANRRSREEEGEIPPSRDYIEKYLDGIKKNNHKSWRHYRNVLTSGNLDFEKICSVAKRIDSEADAGIS